MIDVHWKLSEKLQILQCTANLQHPSKKDIRRAKRTGQIYSDAVHTKLCFIY